MPIISKPKINKLKLIRELFVILIVFLAIALIRFIPWLVQQPISGYDPYSKHYALLNEVNAYDFSNGPNQPLENKLNAATSHINSDPIGYFYNQKAKAIYYLKIQNFYKSIEALDVAIRFAPIPPEEAIIYGLYIENYQALKNLKKVNEYQELLNAVPN